MRYRNTSSTVYLGKNGFSLMTWVYTLPSEETYYLFELRSHEDPINWRGFQVYAQNGNLYIQTEGDGTGRHKVDVNGSLPVGRWVHLAVVRKVSEDGNTSKLKVYINGIQKHVSDFEVDEVPASQALYFGAGKLALTEISLWNIALSQRDIQSRQYHSLNASLYSGLIILEL